MRRRHGDPRHLRRPGPGLRSPPPSRRAASSSRPRRSRSTWLPTAMSARSSSRRVRPRPSRRSGPLGRRRPVVGDTPRQRRVPHQDRGAPAVRSRAVQRHRPRRVVQRVRWPRGQPGLDVSGPADRPRRLRLCGGVGPGVRRRRRSRRSSASRVMEQRSGLVASGRRALRVAAPPRRPVRLRHVLADRAGPSRPRRRVRVRPAARRNASWPWASPSPRSS